MSDKKIIINTQGGTVITGGTFSNVEFVAQKYVYNAESKRELECEGIEEAVVDTDGEHIDNSFTQEIPESVKECFRFPSVFVKQQVEVIVKEFYLNKPVNLALIEVALFDHGQLHQRNSHTKFVKALIDWDILPNDMDIKRTVAGLASKFKRTPLEGYKQWDNNHLNDRASCTNIGKKLPESMKYNR
jgi:hypothetical protein